MINVLITGAAGFVGFHLAHHLHLRGDKVIGLDNFNDYYNPHLKKQRSDLLKNAGIEIFEGDINNLTFLLDLIQKYQITHIAHLAAQAGVRYSLINPQAYIKTNLEGFINILEVCRKAPHIKLIYASSSSVYGLNKKTPFSVQDSTDQQASLYGVTKKTNELMASTYHHLFGIPAIGLRFFTVYGPWGRPDMAYYTFTESILKNETIKVYNYGKMERDFTYIDDIIQGTAAALDRQTQNHEIYNLGNHQPVELLYFIQIIEQALGKKAKMEFLPMQDGDVLTTYADIQESQKNLGFYPKTSLEEGIPKFIEWYLKYKEFSNTV